MSINTLAYFLAVACVVVGVLTGEPISLAIGVGCLVFLTVLPWVSRFIACATTLREYGEPWTDRDWHYVRKGEYPRDTDA